MATVAQLDRRMLAILAADMVGYSRLMEADEAGTIARLQAVRAEVMDPLIAGHRGRLVKLMGDGALAAFESVVDAVGCAVALQRTMAARNAELPEAERTVLRVGVNLGDVALIDGDVYGDGVNVAARLEQLCDPGGVMISGTVYDQLHGKLDLALDFAGEQRFKNIARPVRAYRVPFDDGARRRRPLPAGRRRWLPIARSTTWVGMPPRVGWQPESPRTSSPTLPASASST
jgi:class 3 adenylate cyclase